MSEFEPRKKVDEEWKRRVQQEKVTPAPASPGEAAKVKEASAASPAGGAAPGRGAAAERPAARGGERPARGPHAQAADEAAAAARSGSREPLPEATFSTFVASLAQQAVFSLGLMEHPMTGAREMDLEHAKYMIDVLRVLRDKTHGNLSAQESRHLESLLYELEMGFVECANAAMSGGKDPGDERPQKAHRPH